MRADEWPANDIATLKALWPDRTKSTTAIGRVIHRSKNAVVGKAHRLDLPPRAPRRPYAQRPTRVTGPTLPPLPPLQQTDP